MRWIVLACFALIGGCGSQQKEVGAASRPKPSGIDEDAVIEKGTANIDTWLLLDGHDTKIRVPNGWEWEHRGVRVQAVAKDRAAGYVLTGAGSKDEALKRRQAAQNALKLAPGTAKSKGETLLGGLKFLRQDYTGSFVDGKSAISTELVGASPTGTGYVILVGYATEGHDEELREAINSVTKK